MALSSHHTRVLEKLHRGETLPVESVRDAFKEAGVKLIGGERGLKARFFDYSTPLPRHVDEISVKGRRDLKALVSAVLEYHNG